MKRILLILIAVLTALLLPFTALAGDLTFRTTTLDGKSYSDDNLKNYRLTMVNFWSEISDPCVSELPDLQSLYSQYEDLLVLGVWVGEDKNYAISTAAGYGVTYPLLNPAGGLSDYALKCSDIPATFFFDKDGKQVGNSDGYIGSHTYDEWYAIILDVLQDVSAPQPPSVPEKPSSVFPAKSSLTIKGVRTQTVPVTCSSLDDSVKTVKSDNPKVAKAGFSGNTVIITSAKEPGKATVTVTTVKGATAQIAVTVKRGYALNKKEVSLKKGKSFRIKVLSIPATVKALDFKSNKPAVATVDSNGKVRAVSKGKAKITVTLSNSKTLKLKVIVK